jgi:hypothetical protein
MASSTDVHDRRSSLRSNSLEELPLALGRDVRVHERFGARVGREAPRPGNMVMCDGFDGLCNLSVHPRCYGLAAMPLSSWSCNACSQGILPYDTQLRDRTLRVIRACTTPLLGQ